MAKRGRPRKSQGGAPPPPDRKSFEQQPDDTPPALKRLRIEHLRFETFERPKIEQAEQAHKRKLEQIEREREQAREQLAERARPEPRPRPSFADQRPDGPSMSDILVPMTCAAKKTRYLLRFKWLGTVWGSPEAIFQNGERGQGKASGTSLPLDKMRFPNSCPACAANCGPILCNACNQYLCFGGVEDLAFGGRMHHCACGYSGVLTGTLREVSASKSASAQAPGNAPGDLFRLTFKRS